MTEKSVILATSYFPPVQYFSKVLSYDRILIEIHDNYVKQTYRNRCCIYSANGLINLIVPIQRGGKLKTKVCDIKVSYETDWQKLHFRAIESAYQNSPFYEYYIDDFMPVFEKKWNYLFELNSFIFNTVISSIEISRSYKLTSQYMKFYDLDINDFRESIHPKEQNRADDTYFIPLSYKQVFDDKFGFMPNLSFIDLLFNEGPNALTVLEDSTIGYVPDYKI